MLVERAVWRAYKRHRAKGKESSSQSGTEQSSGRTPGGMSRRNFLRTAAEVGATVYVGGQVATVAATEHGILPQGLGRDIAHLTTLEPERNVLTAATKAYKGWSEATGVVENAAAKATHLADTVVRPADVKIEEFKKWWEGLNEVEKKLLKPVAWVADFLDAVADGVGELANGLDTAAKGNREQLDKFDRGETFPGAMQVVYGDDPLPGEKKKN